MPRPTPTQKAAIERLQKIDPQAEVLWDDKLGVATRLRGALAAPQTGTAEAVAGKFLAANKALFAMQAPETEVQLRSAGTDPRGNQHLRYRQVYKGLPVFGGELIVHLTPDNAVNGVNGSYSPIKDLPTEPKVSAADANQTMLADLPGNRAADGQKPILLVLFQDKEPHLAWHMTVDGTDKALDGGEMPARWAYFVDALTGRVLWRYNNLQTDTATTGTGAGKYAGAVTIDTVHDVTPNQWELQDRFLPSTARVYTHNCNNGYPPAPVSIDSNNNWSATGQGPEVDCHAYSHVVFDYFMMMHGRNSYNNAGADMHIYAHTGSHWNNAGWTGSNVLIGDGDCVTYDSFCTLDIVAHEWTHAVTQYTANLTYYAESGALNESMSDVFAALIDGDWLQGEDNWLNMAEAPAGRNLADPTNGGKYNTADPIGSVLKGHQPDYYPNRYTGTADNAGVHINSGIMNKAAYLIAVGGTHRSIKVCEGLGREVLGRLYYQALTHHLTQSANFAAMRQAVLDSLADLYAGDPRYQKWHVSINNAFAAVDVGTAQKCPSVLGCIIGPINPACPGPIVICPSAPILACLPSPTLSCPSGPVVACPPAPAVLSCPPAPAALSCPPGPAVGCLPGPDPSPFDPRIDPRIDPRRPNG